MRHPWLKSIAAISLAAMLGACAGGLGKTVVVVVPGADGSVGAVELDDGKKKQILDKAYAAAHVDNSNELRPVELKRDKVEELFGRAIAARPVLPRKFTLYFKSDKDELVAESEAVIKQLFADIARRQSYVVEVVGHTDRKASDDYNDRLSRRRAGMVRDELIKRGGDGASILATGRGERDPVTPTADGVSERRNRRVEVTVR